MNFNQNIPEPILEILERCRKKVNEIRHKDPKGEFQDTQDLSPMTEKDVDPNTMPYDEDDGNDMDISDDEEEEAAKAKKLKQKKILAAGGLVAGLAVMAVLGNSFLGGNSSPQKHDPSEMENVAQVSPQGLPESYGDIAKYDDKQNGQNGQTNPNNPNTQAPRGANNGKGTVNTSGQNQDANAQGGPSGYKEKYAQQQSQPQRSSAPAAAPAQRSSSSGNTSRNGGTQVTVTKNTQAEKAEQDRLKAEQEAMNSAIAFRTAVAATRSSSGSGNSAVTNTTASGSGSGNTFTAANSFAAVADSEPMYLNGGAHSGGLYTLQAGAVIPATLLTGITSDVPGADVVAEVRQNVYDSQTGTHLLIPQGARIIGTSGKAGSRGNARIGVVFKRIILPDGSSITLPDQQAIDGTGMPGMKDQYTQHSGSIFRTAFMTSLLGAAAQSATGNTSGDDNRSPGQEAVSGAVAEVLQAAEKLIDRAADQEATITIRPGAAFSIFVNQDLQIPEILE